MNWWEQLFGLGNIGGLGAGKMPQNIPAGAVDSTFINPAASGSALTPQANIGATSQSQINSAKSEASSAPTGGGDYGAAIAAGAAVVGGLIEGYFGNRINKEMFKIRQIEKEVGKHQADMMRQSAIHSLYQKQDTMRESAAIKAQKDHDAMRLNESRVAVKIASTDAEGQGATEVRTALTNAKAKVDMQNIKAYQAAEKEVALAEHSIQLKYIAQNTQSKLGNRAPFYAMPNLGELGLEAMAAYYKYTYVGGDTGNLA